MTVQMQSKHRPKSRFFGSSRFLLLLFIVLGFIYGSTTVAGKFAVASFAPLQITALRLGLSLVILHILYRQILGKSISVPRPLLGQVWMAGIMMQALPFALFFWGLKYTSAGLAGILDGTVPLFIFIFSYMMTKKQGGVSTKDFLSVVCGMSGIILVFAPTMQLSGHGAELLGAILVLLSSIFFALGTMLNHRLLKRHSELNLDGCLYQQTLASTLLIGLLSLMIDGLPAVADLNLSLPAIFSIVYLAVVANALGNYLYLVLTKAWGSMRAGATTYLIPIAAVLLDFLFFKRLPTAFESVGALTIILGIAVLQMPTEVLIPKRVRAWVTSWQRAQNQYLTQ